MNSISLQTVIRAFGAVRCGNRMLAPCPRCQPDVDQSAEWKLELSPGRSQLAVIYCHRCGQKGNREHNRTVMVECCRLVGLSPELLGINVGGEASTEIWQSVGVRNTTPPELTHDPDLLHGVYSDLLDGLELEDRHGRWLRKRGLDPDWAFAAGYRSTPEDSLPLAQQLFEKWGLKLAAVPGFCGVLSGELKLLLRQRAVLTPSRDCKGRVLALKQRLLDGGKARMRLLSSGPCGGPKAVSQCHVPLGVGGHQWSELWITEGERKADCHFTRTGRATVGIPGVSNWSMAFSGLQTLLSENGTVVVALDRDGKPQTQRAQEQLIAAVRSRGLKVKVAEWAEGKGIDDAVVKGQEIVVREAEVEKVIGPSPTFDPPKSPQPKLTDKQIVDYIRAAGSVHRCDLPLRHGNQERLIDGWLKSGVLVIVEKTARGQVLRVKE